MSEQTALPVVAPSLPKGGGAVQSIGKGWGTIGAHGAASYEIALPVSPGRGFAPSLSLSYGSSAGNGVFGIGWGVSLPTVGRHVGKGVPAYTEDDEIIGPNGVAWMPERDPQGIVTSTRIDHYNDLNLNTTYTVVRHFPRLEADFARIEHWSSENDPPGFWLVHGADGSLQLYGKNPLSRRADPHDSRRVGEWLLEEQLNAHGEHILYQYATDTAAQRYLSRVSYGNFKADAHLYLWKADRLQTVQWHFELVFDYGERSTQYEQKPAYAGQQWLTRSDAFSSFAYGFELRTERLCRQVLMFHRFPDELGTEPVLVRRLLFDYHQTPLGYHHLNAAHDQAFGDSQTADNQPPVEFTYSEFKPLSGTRTWQPFQNMPGLNDDGGYQLVDLYGEGLPGVLYRNATGWYYREPMRAKPDSNEVAYEQWRPLPNSPALDTGKPAHQLLSDLTGDGRLDWLVAQPGLSGFFSLGPDRNWSKFATFNAFPVEFFNPHGQLADLVGEGLCDLTLIGPRSVRLFANQREYGFAAAREVAREEDEDSLPILSSSPTELVAFSDILGSGQQHLVRIRHNEVKCWPNLGHGRFGKGFVVGSPGLAYETFDASRIRLADLDGSGAADLIYLEANQALIFMNRSGNGLAPCIPLPWPQGVRYDRLCQVSIADLQGLGCSSLILSVPHMAPRHWRYDFAHEKPYLLTATNNNRGAAGSIGYRSSAQEWLDEKAQKIKAGQPLTCHLPFALHLVSHQSQFDEMTGNRLTQHFTYRQGYYDGIEREFRGFGLLLQTDSETHPNDADSQTFTAPRLTKSWFHTGQAVDMPRTGYHRGDKNAVALGRTLLCQYQAASGSDTLITSPDSVTTLEMARALSGRLLRSETFGIENQPKPNTLYSAQENRYQVRLLQPPTGNRHHARMLPLSLESSSYQYEGFIDDPQCQHTLNLQHDRFGALTHCVSIHYARRQTVSDTPPYSDADWQQWWRDAHDPAQQFYYLNETRAEFIHLETPQQWRLGLPYRQRSNALRRPKAPEPGGLATSDITCEKLLEFIKESDWAAQSILTGLNVQRYRNTSSAETLPDGHAHFEGLTDHLETAELDETALKAFHVLSQASRPKGKLLERSGYHRMSHFLPVSTASLKLWSVKNAFTTYAGLEGFYRAQTLQPSKSHGEIEIRYDKYGHFINAFKLPDGCITQATYDYRTLQPQRITDPNGNIQEGRYDGFGQVLATSIHRHKNGKTQGFKPLDQYRRPVFTDPSEAIRQAKDALQDAANAIYYAPFSWMGRCSEQALKDIDWLKRCVANGDLLPGGYIRASARRRLATLATPSADELKLQAELDSSAREPVHTATLVADRYHDDDDRQIRIAVTCHDGFGRTLQYKQKVEPGTAFVVSEKGALALDGDAPLQQVAAQRWRVSERVEYNNKGLAIRTYRPYFADKHHYIDDESLRLFGHYDLQFYDPLGRLTCTRLAKQGDLSYLRRTTRHPWFNVDEDENDTLEDITPKNTSAAGGDS